MEENEKEYKDMTLKNVAIKQVTKGQNANDNRRYYLELDCEKFVSFKDGKEIMTNSISKNITTLCKEIGPKIPILNTAFAMA